MHKHALNLSIISLGALVVGLHVTAIHFSLYWIFGWFDIMMHFLGGMFVAAVGVWFYDRFRHAELAENPIYVALFNVIVLVFIVGLLWETCEILFGVTFTTQSQYVGDTILDLIMNTIGAVAGFYGARKMALKLNEG